MIIRHSLIHSLRIWISIRLNSLQEHFNHGTYLTNYFLAVCCDLNTHLKSSRDKQCNATRDNIVSTFIVAYTVQHIVKFLDAQHQNQVNRSFKKSRNVSFFYINTHNIHRPNFIKLTWLLLILVVKSLKEAISVTNRICLTLAMMENNPWSTNNAYPNSNPNFAWMYLLLGELVF